MKKEDIRKVMSWLGKRKLKTLTPARRSKIARDAAKARWKKLST